MMALPNNSAIASLPAVMPSSTFCTGPVLTLSNSSASCAVRAVTAHHEARLSGASGFAMCPGGVVAVASDLRDYMPGFCMLCTPWLWSVMQAGNCTLYGKQYGNANKQFD